MGTHPGLQEYQVYHSYYVFVKIKSHDLPYHIAGITVMLLYKKETSSYAGYINKVVKIPGILTFNIHSITGENLPHFDVQATFL